MKTCDTFIACLSSIVGYRFGNQCLVDYFEYHRKTMGCVFCELFFSVYCIVEIQVPDNGI
jgi:hypothetical protein